MSRLHHRVCSQRGGRRCGRWRTPCRMRAIHRRNRRRTTSSISALRGGARDEQTLLVGGYSCLWPPERQTSAAQVATCTDNGSAGAGFSGAVRKNRHEIHDLHRRERARYFEKRHWNSCASMSFWNAGGKLKHSVLFASFPKLLGDGRSRARARRLQDFGVVHTLPDRPTQEDVSRNQKTPSPLPRER